MASIEEIERRMREDMKVVHSRITKHSNRSEEYQKQNKENQRYMIKEISKLKDNDAQTIKLLTNLEIMNKQREEEEKKNKERTEKILKTLASALKYSIMTIATVVLTASGSAITDMLNLDKDEPQQTIEAPKEEKEKEKPQPTTETPYQDLEYNRIN